MTIYSFDLKSRRIGTMAQPPAAAVDPFYAQVILLLNGRDGAVDRGPLNVPISVVGSPTIDNTQPFNEHPTFNVQGNGRYVWDSGTTFSSLIGADEWCIEYWLRFEAFHQGVYNGWCGGFSAGSDGGGSGPAGSAALGATIGGGSYTIGGAVTLESWFHLTLIRNNQWPIDGLAGRLTVHVDGVYGGASGNFDPATALAVNDGLRAAIGYFDFPSQAPRFQCAGVRFTKGTQRYTVGRDPTLPFTPDMAPFLTM